MGQPAIRDGLLSLDEYLELERTSPLRHEYVAGSVFALAGGTRRHNRITLNIARHLAEAVGEGPCRVSVADVRLRVSPEVFYYPDVMVACGPEPEDPYIEEAPCLIVEVASPTTDATDRREKLLVYRKISELELYLIVDQDERRIERHWRDADHTWHAAEIREGAVTVPRLGIELSLEDVYRGVTF